MMVAGGSGTALALKLALEYRQAQKIHEAEAEKFRSQKENHETERVIKDSRQSVLREDIIRLREKIGL